MITDYNKASLTLEVSLEKKFLTTDLKKTPEQILKTLFQYMDESRCNLEVFMNMVLKEISRMKEHIEQFNEELKTETEKKWIKSIKKAIKNRNAKIVKLRYRHKLLDTNHKILWLNQLRIGRILGYELED